MTQQTIDQLTGRYIKDYIYDVPADKWYRTDDFRTSNPELYVGVELEIEGWRGGGKFNGLTMQNDGSLRNNGVEWITYPTKVKHLSPLLGDFFKYFKITENNYSERCSTHVHVNVQDFTPTKLATLILLYQLFERLLFNFVGNNRANNIFCVPWYQAGMTLDLINQVAGWNTFVHKGWQKYTALNLQAVFEKGTVEYRHLEGTCDVSRIMTWVNMLGCLHNYAYNNELEAVKDTIINLNTSSAYEVFLEEVFKEWSTPLKREHYQIAMEEGVMDCKYMLTNTKVEPAKPKVEARFDYAPPPIRPRAGNVERAAAAIQNARNFNEGVIRDTIAGAAAVLPARRLGETHAEWAERIARAPVVVDQLRRADERVRAQQGEARPVVRNRNNNQF